MFSPRGLSPIAPAPGPQAQAAPQPPPTRKTAGLFSPDPNVHLFDRLAIVIKHWKAAAAVAILVVAAMMYQTYTTVPLYRAQSRIQIDEEQTTVQTDFKEPYLAYSDPEPYSRRSTRFCRAAISRFAPCAISGSTTCPSSTDRARSRRS